MIDMHAEYRIGCSGYYYPDWKGKIYPEELKPKNWLQHYSTIFNTVELNGTFYHTPKLSSLQTQASATPEDFRFAVKMSRYITHILRLKDSKQNIKEFQKLIKEGLGKKLLYYLFQMPPSFHYTEENMERIIKNIPHHPRNVIELRHISWWNNEVKKAFEKAHLTFCNVDFPGINSFFIQSSSEFYLRLHGNPELFKTPYTKHKLEEFHKLFPENCNNYTVYFNNTYAGAAYYNALQLMDVLKKNEVLVS
jgi:uncharacterized protein YecE (DUF72 family)